METTDGSLPDFQAIFQAGPDPYLVVDRNFRIVAVADAYLKATMTRRQDILGRHISDAACVPSIAPARRMSIRITSGRVRLAASTAASPVKTDAQTS